MLLHREFLHASHTSAVSLWPFDPIYQLYGVFWGSIHLITAPSSTAAAQLFITQNQPREQFYADWCESQDVFSVTVKTILSCFDSCCHSILKRAGISQVTVPILKSHLESKQEPVTVKSGNEKHLVTAASLASNKRLPYHPAHHLRQSLAPCYISLKA